MENPEIDLIALPDGEWREMLAAASELDLVHGGYFRARPRAIFFYAGPDNAPAGWSGPFADGSPEAPRAAVGQAEVIGHKDPDGLTVRLTVSNWRAMRAVKEAYERGEYRGRFEQFVMDQETALRGREEDRAWLRVQFRRLQSHAAGSLVEEG